MKRQVLGIVFVVSLILSIIFLDRMINLDLPFSLSLQDWHPISYWLAITSLVCIIFLIIIKSEKVDKVVQEGKESAKHSLKEKIILIVSNTCSGSLLDILVVLSFLGFVAWIPDSISDFTKEGLNPIRPILYVFGLALMIWGKPSVYTKGEKVLDDKRRLLLTSMSNVSTNNINIVPLLKPFGKYKNIETVVVLLSNTIWKGYANIDPSKESNLILRDVLLNYKNEIDKLKFDDNDTLIINSNNTGTIKRLLRDLLNQYIKETYPSYREKLINIDFSDPVDYNDFDECNNECFYKLNYVMRKSSSGKKYTDDDIVVNTSPGTSAVTSALTINAIKGNRAMVYTKQDKTTGLMEANPNVTLIQFEGLLQDRKNGW